MKGKKGYNHFCTYTSFYGGWYTIGWYTDSIDRRIRHPKQHSYEAEREEAVKFCNYHNIPFPKE